MAAPVRQHHLHHAAAHDRSGRRCTNSRRYGEGDARVGRESLIQSRSVHTTNPVRSGAPESAGTPSAPIARRGRTRAGTAANRVIASRVRSEEHTSELQSLMRISYAVFCLKKKNEKTNEVMHQDNTISYIQNTI